LRVRAATIPNGHDPDDFLNNEGADALRALVDGAPDALELVIRNAVRQGTASPDQKSDVVAHVAPLIAKVADAVSRDEYARRLSMAVDASVSAVSTIVRDAARGSSQTRQVDSASLGIARERRDAPEERQLRALATFCLQRPQLIGDETALRLQEILPGGAWKSIILQIIAAADEGLVLAGGEGGVDAFAIESRLDEEAAHRLREIAVDEQMADSDRPTDLILQDLLGWFDKRQRDQKKQEINRRLRDPNEDHEALLKEKQTLLLEKRARLHANRGAGSGSKAPANDELD